MSESTIWWLLAGAAVALELVTGTFYLLMIAAGFVAGAITAHLGLALIGQMVVAAAVGGGAVAAWHWNRSKNPAPLPVQANRDVNLDIGESVQVAQWNADGTTIVKFRGANWTAVAASPAEPASTGSFRIKEMLGNRLVIEKL